MPTYEYHCEKCKKSFDCQQSMKDPAFSTCPKEFCRQKTWGKGRVKRQMGTGAGLIFKGSGFYITDYRSDKYKEAAKKDSAPAPAPASDGKSSGDSKPAKTETKSESKAAKTTAAKT